MSNTVKALEKRRRKFLIEKITWCLIIIFGNLLFCLVERNIFLCVALVSAIDSRISNAVQQSSKLSMTKVLKNGRMETTVSAEREPQKENSTDLWKKNVFFSSQVCDFYIEKVNLPEMTIFYVNQNYLSYKDNKKMLTYRLSVKLCHCWISLRT